MRVGVVKYINALPFYFGKPIPQDLSLTFATPRQLNAMLRNKEIDVALTSCTEYFDGNYQLLPGFCIAAYQEIMSVNLYLQGAIDGATIGLTQHSATASSLLEVLCHHFWKASPNFVPLDREQPFDTYDGFLLIGDEALKRPHIPGFQTIDLAHAWYEATQLPFVFAVFCAHPEINLTPLQTFLESTNIEDATQEGQRRSELPLDRIRHYYELCHYRLDQRELEGLNKFKELREHVSFVVT